MISYIAITGATANWLLAQAARKAAISDSLPQLASLPPTSGGVIHLGALRIAVAKQASLVAIWNVDLLSGRGHEKWGIARLSGEDSLLAMPQIATEVFERFLQVTDLRLSGLKLDDRMIHRHIGDDMHTCLAGRGTVARQLALAFSDKPVEIDGLKIANLIASGPAEVLLGNVPQTLRSDRRKAGASLVNLRNCF